MKAFLSHRSRRGYYHGWALRVRGATRPIDWTTSTTREEARELRRERGNLLRDCEVVKVKVTVEAVGG